MKPFSALLLILAAGLVPAFSLAGAKVSKEVHYANVTVNGQNRVRVTGTIMGARNSADNLQYINCRPAAEIGYCGARDANGITKMCSTSDPMAITAMTGINAASHLSFEIAVGTCKNVEVVHSSMYIEPFASFVPQPTPGAQTVSP